jgi:hypothetical protein
MYDTVIEGMNRDIASKIASWSNERKELQDKIDMV